MLKFSIDTERRLKSGRAYIVLISVYIKLCNIEMLYCEIHLSIIISISQITEVGIIMILKGH